MYNPQPFTRLDFQTIGVTYGIDRDFSENEILELNGKGNTCSIFVILPLSLLTYAFFKGGN